MLPDTQCQFTHVPTAHGHSTSVLSNADSTCKHHTERKGGPGTEPRAVAVLIKGPTVTYLALEEKKEFKNHVS